MFYVPVYVVQIDGQFVGESPLVPGVTFKGATPHELTEYVRAVWPNLAAQAVENPQAIAERHAHEYEGRGGIWATVPVLTVDSATGGGDAGGGVKRVNLSIAPALLDLIDRTADAIGQTRSGWIASAAREKLQRG